MKKLIFLSGLLFLLAGFFQPALATHVWTITPDAFVQQEYTDNLFQDRDNRKSEWITILGAGLELEALGATQGMTLGYRPSYSMYHKYDEFNTLRHYADLELWKNIREHLRLSFINSFEYREQPYDPDDLDSELYPDFLDDDDLRRGREPRTINTARARMDYRFGPRNTAYLQYLQRNEWNDNPGEEDSQRYSSSAGMTYWFNILYGIEAAASYTHGRYDISENRNIWDGRIRLMRNFSRFLDGYVQYRHSHVKYSGDETGYFPARYYTVYEPSLGISYRFDQDGRLSIGLGYYFRDREDGEKENRLVLNADIDKTWTQRRSSFTLRGSSGYGETSVGTRDQGFTVYYLGRAVYTYALSRDLDWDLYAGYRRNVYKDRDPERSDNVYNLGTGLSYMLTRQINVGLNYDYRRVDSNIRAEEYYENRGTLTLNWRPQPKRLN